MTDDDFEYDLDEVKRNIDSAEVMSVFFPALRRSVVIDTRTNEHDGPMERIMPMVATPRYIDSLVGLGVWERIVNRFEKAGQSEAVAACEAVLEELRALEKAEMAAVVRGENYHTLWSARD